jgi:chromosome segregation ATPase
MQELIEEIAFQKVLLNSIDDSVQNREAAEDEVKEEIRELDSRLRALRRNTKASQSSSQQSSSSMPSTPNSADSLGDLVSPSQMTLPSRKRSHSKHLDGVVYPLGNIKSRRTSPGLTGPTTPSSITSSGYVYSMFGHLNLTSISRLY